MLIKKLTYQKKIINIYLDKFLFLLKCQVKNPNNLPNPWLIASTPKPYSPVFWIKSIAMKEKITAIKIVNNTCNQSFSTRCKNENFNIESFIFTLLKSGLFWSFFSYHNYNL